MPRTRKPVRRGPKRAGMREIERAILSENGALVQKEAEKQELIGPREARRRYIRLKSSHVPWTCR